MWKARTEDDKWCQLERTGGIYFWIGWINDKELLAKNTVLDPLSSGRVPLQCLVTSRLSPQRSKPNTTMAASCSYHRGLYWVPSPVAKRMLVKSKWTRATNQDGHWDSPQASEDTQILNDPQQNPWGSGGRLMKNFTGEFSYSSSATQSLQKRRA